MRFKAMTFNLRVNTPEDGPNAWPHRARHVARLIRETEPLVVGTQEGLPEMLRELDESLPQYGRIGLGRSGQKGTENDEHCAIFYRSDRLRLADWGQFFLSETPDVPGSRGWDGSLARFCTWGEFTFADDPAVTFYVLNTHFDHIGQKAREESASLVCRRLEEMRRKKNAPAILMGDLNAEPDNPAVRRLMESSLFAGPDAAFWKSAGRSFHGFEGGTEGAPIDYILVTPEIRIHRVYLDRRQMDGMYPSDHYPVVAEVEIGSSRETGREE